MDLESKDEEVVAIAAYYILLCNKRLLLKKKRRNSGKRRWWMIALNKSRGRYNASNMLCELRSQPSGRFENFCRLTAIDFEDLPSRIGPVIAKQDTVMRKCVPIQERLAIGLRFFATGDTYASLSYLFKVSKQTIFRCVDDVRLALIQELKDEVTLPTNLEEWLQIARDYESMWNFPNCIGAIDGKHIVMECPKNTMTEFYNYKGTFSVILLALVDAKYRFLYVDIGCQGRISDGGVFTNSSLYSKLQSEQLHLPPDRQLPSFQTPLPYVFIGDSAFASSRHMMKPYPGTHEKGSPQRIFGYRLSRARRIVENVFGILAAVFRIFRRPMALEREKVSNVTLACVLLHNYMRRSPAAATFYTPAGTFDTEVDGEVIPGSWRNDQSGLTSFFPLKKLPKKPGIDAKTVRDTFATYFTTTGKLP